MSTKISVIIVTGGVKDYCKACYDSVAAQAYPPDEVIIVRNPLHGNSGSPLISQSAGVKVLTQGENLFYCQALNLGIAESKGELVLCLNDDVTLDKRFIEAALRGFSIDGKVGMVCGKILRSDGKTIDSTGLFLSYWRTARERGYGRRDRGQFEKEGFTFGVNGAVAFYRRAMLDQIKIDDFYFDPAFRIFYEDLDIAWRAQRHGWQGYYVPQAIAYHARGGTVRQGRGIGKAYASRFLAPSLQADLLKNRYLTILRNESKAGFLLHLPGIFLYDLAMWLFVFLCKPGAIKPFFSRTKSITQAFRKRSAK